VTVVNLLGTSSLHEVEVNGIWPTLWQNEHPQTTDMGRQLEFNFSFHRVLYSQDTELLINGH